MMEIANYTKKDSSAMTQFSFITLILLPMTVVSVRSEVKLHALPPADIKPSERLF